MFCKSEKRDGGPCRAYAKKDSPYCEAHDPKTRDLVVERLREGLKQRGSSTGRRVQSASRKAILAELTARYPDERMLSRVPPTDTVAKLRAYIAELLPLVLSSESLKLSDSERVRAHRGLLKELLHTFEMEETAPADLQIPDLFEGIRDRTDEALRPPSPDTPKSVEELEARRDATDAPREPRVAEDKGEILLSDLDLGEDLDDEDEDGPQE
jgi:hypothetical protein